MTIGKHSQVNAGRSSRRPRPLAMLGTSRQVQQEFGTMLIPSCMQPSPSGPHHTCYFRDQMTIKWQENSRCSWRFNVSACFQHREAARIELAFQFKGPFQGAVDQKSMCLIEAIISDAFDQAGKFTFLHFLQAVDDLFALGPEFQIQNTANVDMRRSLEFRRALTIEGGSSHTSGSCAASGV